MEQIGVGQIAEKEHRLIFVDPNDVYDKDANNAQQGLSLTPKYEDFCISFNLIIEAFSRFKSSGSSVDKNGEKNENGEKRVYSIEWGMTKEQMIKNRTSVLQGNRGQDTLNNADGSFASSDSNYNFLTTYYTDLTFDSYRKKTEIEGLGVESVQISYESWYTPTVSIKFVDVRGSALFGREEAIHIDEKLTAENIFGAFFTMPYPLFRLQVKGFLGRPVTYQLTCSSFKGEFNSQTGNFEAVATFIGYSWSLLTDIPFTYIVAAPNSTYIGTDYWERHRNTREWGLWDDGNTTVEPPKLITLFNMIRNADQKINSAISAVSSEKNESLQGISNEQKLLNDISTHLNAFIGAIKSQVDSKCLGAYYDENEKKQQILLFSDNKTLKVNEDTLKKYEDMYTSLKQYTTSFTGKNITTDKAPNKWTSCPKEITFLDKFIVDAKKDGTVESIRVKDLTTLTTDGLKKIVFNDKGGKLTNKSAEGLYEAINKSKSPNIKKYVYLLDLYDISTLIGDRSKIMSTEQDNITKEINEEVNYHIKSILGFKPYIGNVFKIIFCHLETFCHIMFDSAEEIYAQMKSGDRKPSKLKINFDTTDIAKGVNEDITPWPAIYDNGYKSQECGYTTEIGNVYGWVGDFSNNFIEEKVVYALQEGIQQIVDSMTNANNELKTSAFPITPFDYSNNGAVFDMVGQSNISDLSGYLSMRAASIIGVMSGNKISDNLATLMGKMDAYNFYSTNSNTSVLKKILEDKTLKDIKGIAYCDVNFDKWTYGKEEGTENKYHFFETVKKIREDYNKNGRKPIFKLVNSSNLFVHWYDKKQISYVPSSLKNFKNYSEDFEYNKNDGVDPYFTPKVHERADENIQTYDWIYNCDTTKISVFKPEDKEKYVNKYMFNIIEDDNRVAAIVQKHDQLKTGGCKVYEYEVKDDLKDYINTFLKVSKEYKAKFYNRVGYMLSGNREKLGIKETDLLPDAFDDKKKGEYNFTYTAWDESQNSNLKNCVMYNDAGDLTLNGNAVTINDVVIQEFKIRHFGIQCNLFGCPFYYLQNEKLKADEKDEDYINRVLRVKSLLFLHTYKYDYQNTNLNVFSMDKKVGGVEIVPKAYLLFLGAMLWRKRYAASHNGVDPVIYSCRSDTDIYKRPSINHTFFANVNNFLTFSTIRSNDSSSNYTYPISGLFGGNDNIDYNIENQLIALFEKFTKNTFSKIAAKYELKNAVKSSEVKEYTSSALKEDIVKFGLCSQKFDKKQIRGDEFEDWLRTFGIENWVGKYSAMNVRTDFDFKSQGLKMLLNEKDKQSQDLFKDLYVGCYIICDACNKRLGRSASAVTNLDQIWVDDKLYEAYITGFLNACNDIINGKTDVVSSDGTSTSSTDSKLIKNRDLSVAIYYYLKNVWDKWLVISDTSAFDVPNYFDKNFIFTDSFYKNVYHYLAINCQNLLNAWTELADNASLFHFLSRLVTDHSCIFLPVPDYVGFNGETQKHDIEMMEDLFRPLPYNAMEAPANSNKFVVIFTHSPSSIKDDSNGFKSDSYDIWSHTEGVTDIAKTLFQSTNSKEFDRDTGIATREGYNVPSFCISFGRQNNHIFKNLKVSMDNPVMTEQAIKATWEIAKMGSGGGRKVNFIGQDTFNVFSNYSYTVNVEMMGNAQICPLMYFQLMNIPMWRGTYMIYKVVHNMTAGNMVTTITAMKMSKFAKPFNSTFFVYNPYAKTEEPPKTSETSCDVGGGDSGGSTSGGVVQGTYGKPGMFTGKSRSEKMKMYGVGNPGLTPSQAKAEGLIVDVTFKQSSGTKSLPMNKYIAEDFRKICDEILALGWFKLNVGNCYRSSNSVKGSISRHCWGIAVDINPGKGGNPWFATRIAKNQSEPAQGSQPPWSAKKCPYSGTYDKSKCIWHWNHPVVQIFLAHGWGWGGSYGDVMHFSVDDGH